MVVLRSYFLKSLGRRFVSLHFEHSAMLRSLPFSYRVFITISPPHSGHSNFCVATVVREFLLAPAMTILQKNIRICSNTIIKCGICVKVIKTVFHIKTGFCFFFQGVSLHSAASTGFISGQAFRTSASCALHSSAD